MTQRSVKFGRLIVLLVGLTGYLLYSVGRNGSDDGGSNNTFGVLAGVRVREGQDELEKRIDGDADDYAVRLPRPLDTAERPPKQAAQR